MVAPVMVSCGYRTAARARTVADLARHHVHPTLIRTRCTPARPGLLRRAALHAMRHAASLGADLLYLEDDIRTDDRLLAALELCGVYQHPVALFVSGAEHHPAGVLRAMDAGDPIPLQVLPLRSVGTWWGTQAVYIPRSCMRRLASSPWLQMDRDVPFDIAIRNIYRDAELPLYGVFPNPVQHANEPSAVKVTTGQRNRKERISPTFGWATA